MKAKIKRFYKRIMKVIKSPEMVLLPGQLAFNLVLGIIPTVTLVSYVASVLNLSMDFLYDFMARAFSTDMADLFLSASNVHNAGFKLAVVLVISYYLASNGTNSVIVTSNTIYGIKNGSWFKRRGKAIIMSVIFVLLIAFLLLVPIFGNQIIDLIRWVNLNQNVTDVITSVFRYLKSPFMWIVIFFLIKLIYIMAPDRKIKAHNANYGAIFTTITWIISTYIYSYYINNFANYSAFYGGLASVCIIMIWFYFLAYFFVIGMSLNYQKENEELEKTNSIKVIKE